MRRAFKLPPAEVNQVRHHGVLAHGLGRAGAARDRAARLADRACRQCRFPRAGDRNGGAYRGGEEGDARGECDVPHRDHGGPLSRSYLAGEGAAAPQVQAGDMAAIGSPARFRGAQRLSCRSMPAPPTVRWASVTLPHLPSSPRMASPWLYVGPDGDLLGGAQRQRALVPAPALHFGEWLLRRRSNGGRADRRQRPRDVPAQLSDAAPPGIGRGAIRSRAISCGA